MPLYAYACETCGKSQDGYASVDERHTAAPNCHGKMKLQIVPTQVCPDIAPYMAVGGDMAGKYITSRKEHREYLKRNRFIEVGNESIKPIKNDFRPKKGEIAQDLKRVIQPYLR